MVSRQRKHELWRRQEVRASRQYIELVQHKERLLKDIEAINNAKRNAIREVRTKMAAERDKLKKQLKQVRARIAYINSHLSEFAPKKPRSRVNKK